MGIDLNAQGDVTVGGDVVGGDKVVQQTEQVASGKYVLQIGSVSGGVVNIAQPGASDVAPSAGCGYYRWRVRAVDGAGNPGSYSNDAYFGETIG